MIDGGLAAVRLAERRLKANVMNAVTGDVPIRLTMEGASELTLTLSDPDGRFRRSRFMNQATRVRVGEHPFALVKTAKQGQDITLTAEDAVIHKLRRRKGPKKAFRGKVTRAQFIRSLVKEVDPDIPFFCPELTKVQPIGKPEKATGTKTSADGREAGIPRNAKGLTVKGIKATATQIKVADEVIRAALRYNPPHRAVVALLCAATVESVMGTLGMTAAGMESRESSVGLLQARTIYVPLKLAMSIPYNVKRFMVEPWTGTSYGGAIKQANAGRSVNEICASIEGPLAAYANRYGEWIDEANRWIDAYTGGARSITIERTEKKPYAFEVGKNEDYWTAIKRLADEVGWRAFTAGGRFYYTAEPTLFRSRRRINIGVNTRGVDDVDFDVDGRKKASTATLTARADIWRALPGTVVSLSDHWGPAEGRWLVAEVNGSLVSDTVDVTLKRPSKPKPEPANETKTTRSTRGIGSGEQGSTAGADKAVAWAKSVVGVTEGSAKWSGWMSKVGGFDPWCGFFIAYMMKYVCGFETLPSNPGYSGSWLTWSKASRVSKTSLKAGDIIVFDWGDGGITDHVALYIGNGRRIGGNESNRVSENPADLGRCVGAVRPNYR